MVHPTMAEELTLPHLATCPYCEEAEGDGKEKVWYFVGDNGVSIGACFNCECAFKWRSSNAD